MAFPVTLVTLSHTIPPIFLQPPSSKTQCWMTAVWINSYMTSASSSDQLDICHCVKEGKVRLKDEKVWPSMPPQIFLLFDKCVTKSVVC